MAMVVGQRGGGGGRKGEENDTDIYMFIKVITQLFLA